MLTRRNYLLVSVIASTLFAATAYADVKFASPAAGVVISGSTISVEFEEGPDDPPLADFTTYTLQLCAGGNTATDYTPLFTFTDKGDFSSLTYTAQIKDLTIGGDTENAYFLRTMGVAPGGVVINFSDRFTLSGMTGQFSAAVVAGLKDVSGTSGPPTENQIANPPAAAAPGGGGVLPAGNSAYNVPYTMQTGPVRYAPMPAKAGTKITADGDARQFATSAYTIWSRSGMPPPDATQTFTDAVTWVYSSVEPTIAPQPSPDDMQKFLNRWRD